MQCSIEISVLNINNKEIFSALTISVNKGQYKKQIFHMMSINEKQLAVIRKEVQKSSAQFTNNYSFNLASSVRL